MLTAVTWVGFSTLFVCVSVFLHNVSKEMQLGLTEPDVQIFHNESWNPFILRSKGQGSRSLFTKTAGMGVCNLVNAGLCFFTTAHFYL